MYVCCLEPNFANYASNGRQPTEHQGYEGIHLNVHHAFPENEDIPG